jgi:outer membrane protein assembly factor BamB
VTHVELSLQHQLMEVRHGQTIELRIESDTMTAHRSVFIVLAAVFALVFAGCNWSQFRYGSDHTGDNNVLESAISTSNVSSLVLRFTAATGGISMSSPAVVNGIAYIGSEDGKLYAFDAAGNTNCSGTPKTCAPLWTASTGSEIVSSPAVVNGVAYVGSEDGKLYAFDAAGNTNCSGTPKTCAPQWTASTGGTIYSSPTVANGIVYVGSEDANLYAFDAAGNTNCSGTPKTCAPLWTALTDGSVYSSAAVSNGVVYVGSQGGNLYAFDAAGATNCSGTPKTCAPLWTYHTGSVSSSPAVANGIVYVGDFLSTVYGFDAAGKTNCSGTPKACGPLWTNGVNSTIGIVSSPAVAGGIVYTGDECDFEYPPQPFNCGNAPHFYAFNAATGALNWTGITTSAPVTSSPGVANGVVFVGSGDGSLYAFDAAGNTQCSGTPAFCLPLWTGVTGSGVDSSPTIANGMVYVGSGDGKLYAFGLP